MSNRPQPVSVNILDKEYFISCSDQEQPHLLAAADFVNKKMRELKEKGSVIGTERIAVMTALNIASELLIYKDEKKDYTIEIDKAVRRLQRKINEALI